MQRVLKFSISKDIRFFLSFSFSFLKESMAIQYFLKVRATNMNIPISSVGSNDDELIKLHD